MVRTEREAAILKCNDTTREPSTKTALGHLTVSAKNAGTNNSGKEKQWQSTNIRTKTQREI